MASFSSAPTAANQYVWAYSESFTKTKFLASVDLDDTTEALTAEAAGILWDVVASYIIKAVSVYATVLVTTATLMNILTNAERKAMMQKIYNQFTDEDNTYTKCKVYLKYKSYQKGSQGWFWMPTSTYTLKFS